MATDEQKELSTYIKTVHSNLRIKSEEIGFDEAWKQHCNDVNNLQKYAQYMKRLATEHWEENAKNNVKVILRVEWVYNFCTQYFFTGGLLKYRKREEEILQKVDEICEKSYIQDYTKLKLIDVGSCYNPFSKYDCFEIIALDIAPACEEIYHCDFLNLNIGKEDIFKDRAILELKRNSCNVIVFSLLIEYLPSPEQRMKCCKNAYNLLQYEGILILITPDSKHVGANAKYMKSWRYTLSLIGFSRICYEKLPYLHCIVFRKSIHAAIPKRWAKMHESDDLFHELYIPQDFQELRIPQDFQDVEEVSDVKNSEETGINLLSQLPFNNS